MPNTSAPHNLGPNLSHPPKSVNRAELQFVLFFTKFIRRINTLGLRLAGIVNFGLPSTVFDHLPSFPALGLCRPLPQAIVDFPVPTYIVSLPRVSTEA